MRCSEPLATKNEWRPRLPAATEHPYSYPRTVSGGSDAPRFLVPSVRPPPRSSCHAAHPRSFRPRLEGLEDRTLLSAGDLDPTFGTGGKVLTGFTGSLNDTASAVVREPDGKYVVAGTSSGSAGFSLALARCAADGVGDGSVQPDQGA